MKVYLVLDIDRFMILCDIALFFLKSSIHILEDTNNLQGYSQSHYHVINLDDIHR